MVSEVTTFCIHISEDVGLGTADEQEYAVFVFLDPDLPHLMYYFLGPSVYLHISLFCFASFYFSWQVFSCVET